MKMYGKANEVSKQILERFRNPETLPGVIAPIFIHSKADIPCRKWSFRNQVLVAMAGTSDARGFKQWQKADRHVTKGSKAFHILSPCTKKVTDKNGEERTACFGFRATSVFRIESTEGADIPEADPELATWIQDLPLLEVAKQWEISVECFNGVQGSKQGFWSPRGVIGLGVENLSTWFHEVIHAADHRLGNLKERGQHWRSETVAELGGAVLATCLGLDNAASDIGGAYRYIEGYAKAAEISAEQASMDCLDRICQAVNLVLTTARELQQMATAAA